MSDFIPQGNVKFNVWQGNLATILEPNVVLWNIKPVDYLPLNDARIIWNNAFAKASSRKNRNSGDVQARVDARKKYTKVLRSFIAQWLSNNNKVPNGDRQRMGITVKSGTRTPASIPVSCPVGTIVFLARMQHKIIFYDSATPRSKAKPKGVQGCEIWVKVGGSIPVNASELTFLATSTCTPYIAEFEGDYIGKSAYYWLRWVNTRGKFGPWSNVISAIVAG